MSKLKNVSNFKNMIEENGKAKLRNDAETLLIMAFCEMLSGKAIFEMTESDLYNAYMKFVGMSGEDMKNVNKEELMARLKFITRQHIESEVQEQVKVEKLRRVFNALLYVSATIVVVGLFLVIYNPYLLI